MTIDPDSPLAVGYCGCGCRRTLELGDTDCWGQPVGYIDADGLSWSDRRERDVCVGSSRYVDAWWEWNRAGGALGPAPDLGAILAEVDVLPQHEDEIEGEIRRNLSPDDLLTAARVARMADLARLN